MIILYMIIIKISILPEYEGKNKQTDSQERQSGQAEQDLQEVQARVQRKRKLQLVLPCARV